MKKNSFGLTSPLITLASGAKMGKTEKGAIWLNEDLLSSYDYWQFWRNTDDRDVERFLYFFTDLKIEEIKNFLEKEKNINKLKILLANEATKILHGKNKAIKAEQTAKQTFESGGAGTGLPEINIKSSELNRGISILEFLSKHGVLSSKSEARRAIANNGIKIHNLVVTDENKIIKKSDFKNSSLKLSFGKKRHYLIKII
tara:strand:- start:178 stop:777 length:600 start_codon:yes stop_codon:yes gene_type:complete